MTKKCCDLENGLSEKKGKITSKNSEIQQLENKHIMLYSGTVSANEKVKQTKKTWKQKYEALREERITVQKKFKN